MDSFNDSLNDSLNTFFTACRDSALVGLETDDDYNGFKDSQRELLNELNTLISPEAKGILERYTEALVYAKSKEYNAVFLRGITVATEIRKRLDTSTSEHKAFAKSFL